MTPTKAVVAAGMLTLALAVALGGCATSRALFAAAAECSGDAASVASGIVSAVDQGPRPQQDPIAFAGELVKLLGDAIPFASCVAASVRQHLATAHNCASIDECRVVKGVTPAELERADRVLTILNVATINTVANVSQ